MDSLTILQILAQGCLAIFFAWELEIRSSLTIINTTVINSLKTHPPGVRRYLVRREGKCTRNLLEASLSKIDPCIPKLGITNNKLLLRSILIIEYLFR